MAQINIGDVSRAFVTARRQARALDGYPGGILPETLDQAYACQDRAIASWPDDVIGWKVGLVPPADRDRLGAERLAGPIFRRAVQTSPGGTVTSFPVFEGGFAAVEAEFVVKLARDIPPGPAIAPDAAADLVAALHLGIEPAGSPLATINDLGPTVVVSDFGNNHGLIIGPEIPHWRSVQAEALSVETIIDGRKVGTGTAASVPGSPLAAVAFLIGLMGRRGITLPAGSWISTGAVTGIHRVQAGAAATVQMAGIGAIHVTAVPAKPLD